MISIKQFKGKIDNKTLSYYKNRVDHTLDTTDDRINNVREILGTTIDENGLDVNSEFWCRAFMEGCCNPNISTENSIYSETDVAIFLENMGGYILAADKKPKADKIKIYDSYSEFDRVRKEKEKLEKLSAINNSDEFLMFRENRNFKKEKKQVVTAEDISNHQILQDYENTRLDYLRMYQTELVGLGLSKADKHKKNLVKKHLGMFKVDMVDVKNSIEQPIIWKNPLGDNNTVNWQEIDFLDKSHVKELLRIKPNTASGELHYILMDFEDILGRVKLSDKQKVVLNLWRDGKSQTEIGEFLGVTQQMIYKQIDVIITKIVSVAESDLEDWYYLNVRKGKYVTCSKCGKNKLESRINKNKCKDCNK